MKWCNEGRREATKPNQTKPTRQRTMNQASDIPAEEPTHLGIANLNYHKLLMALDRLNHSIGSSRATIHPFLVEFLDVVQTHVMNINVSTSRRNEEGFVREGKGLNVTVWMPLEHMAYAGNTIIQLNMFLEKLTARDDNAMNEHLKMFVAEMSMCFKD